MKYPAVSNSFAVPAKSLKSAIQLLRKLDVPATRIAAALGESADNIRHIDSRSYTTEEIIPMAAPVEELADIYLADPDHWSALRRRQTVEIYSQSKHRLEALAAQIRDISKVYEHDLPQGFAALKRLLPHISSATRLEALSVKSLLEEDLGWFAAHLGLSHSAYHYATAAMNHRKQCYEESLGDKAHLIAYAGSALIASNALLMSHKPMQALFTLDLAYQANQAAGQPPGSEWYRQLATALLQHQNYDPLAKRLYDKSGDEMEHHEHYSHPLSIRMNRDRQRYFLTPTQSFEQALELIQEAQAVYGPYSLEHVMAINWAAAVALRLDSPGVVQRAQELLLSLTAQVLPFQHQQTVSRLLSITPALRLSADAKDAWLRFSLYENAARNK